MRFRPPLLLAPLVLSLPLAGLPGQGAAQGRKVALLVGVNQYDHAALPDLKYADNDVEELAKVLTGPGAAFADVAVLSGGRGRGRPTAANIRAQLKRLTAKLTKHDTILVALAGHGVQLEVDAGPGGEKSEAYFCPADARLKDSRDPAELAKSLLPLREVLQALDESGAGVKLLLVDACRDDPKAGRNVDVGRVPRPPRGTAALFSCAAGQRAFETNQLHEKGKGHGVFFHYVLEGLRGRAKNEDNEVTWDELAVYVKRQVSRAVPRVIGGGAQQSPHLVADLVGEPPVLVKLAPSAVTPTPNPADLPQSVTNSLGMKLALVPAGKFTMGSPPDEPGRQEEELQHEVTIGAPFYLGVHEVTQEQYKQVVGKNPSYFAPGVATEDELKATDTSRFPVESVTWEEANAFCAKLSALAKEEDAGRKYRLPTEAEWEYACRGAGRDRSAYHTSDALAADQANFGRKDGCPSPVGKSGLANRLGIFDMHGNVAEWCADRYGRDYYRDCPPKDPSGPTRGEKRVLRGGFYGSAAKDCRSASRFAFESARNAGFGFRVVCVPAKP